MKIRYRLCLLCLVICCWTVGKGVGQNTGKQPLAFEDFFHGKMEKISGIFPVYRDSAKVYMEIPEHLLGRELEIRAQVNKGFDMVARPLESMGVVYLQKVDGHSIYNVDCFLSGLQIKITNYTRRCVNRISNR